MTALVTLRTVGNFSDQLLLILFLFNMVVIGDGESQDSKIVLFRRVSKLIFFAMMSIADEDSRE